MLLHHTVFDHKTIPPGLQETNSPVFASLIEIMGKKCNWVILDLGPAQSANLALLSQFRCKLFIEDAHELIEGFSGDPAADEAVLEAWAEQWTVGPETTSIDVVLAWDMFNYLDAGLCQRFMDHLTPLLKRDAYLYLLSYSQQEMPALPMQFKALAADKMECRPPSHTTRPSPRLNQTDVRKRLREFSVIKSVLLRNGIQEYLMKRTT